MNTAADRIITVFKLHIEFHLFGDNKKRPNLSHAPVLNAIPDKSGLASQPTLSRFFHRMDEDTLRQFDYIDKCLRDIIYSIKHPEHILLDPQRLTRAGKSVTIKAQKGILPIDGQPKLKILTKK